MTTKKKFEDLPTEEQLRIVVLNDLEYLESYRKYKQKYLEENYTKLDSGIYVRK